MDDKESNPVPERRIEESQVLTALHDCRSVLVYVEEEVSTVEVLGDLVRR